MTDISPAFGEHPIHVLSELVAHRLAGEIEERADFIPVNFDIHWSVTSRWVSCVGRTDVGDFEHHVREDAIAAPEGDTDVLHAIPWNRLSHTQEQVGESAEKKRKTYGQVQHTSTKTDGLQLHSTNTRWLGYHKQSDSHYHTALPTCYS